ncbi:MAG: CoA-binding protein [Desulfovibrionaceae bacterium]|nr:CoA-binding protein [Desulfovibrionaceae bacterium]MBF0513815.1 CoA-binding protein [Desulfovibrionaceae bacterium]
MSGNFDEAGVRGILGRAATVAVVGAKDKPGPADDVGRYLIARGFRVIPVHPARADVWGLATYARLADIPEAVDVVDVFRAAEHCPAHAREVLKLPERPKLFWLQSGVVSAEAASMLAGSGVLFVSDACLMVEHRRLFPQ